MSVYPNQKGGGGVMRIRIDKTFDFTPAEVAALAAHADVLGFGYDDTTAPGKLIRRMLTSRIDGLIEQILFQAADGDDEDTTPTPT